MNAKIFSRWALWAAVLVLAPVRSDAGEMEGSNVSERQPFVAQQSGAPVSYFRAENVAKSFAQGAVLFDRGANYMIHTSRRVAPGMAEVHAKDTDLIYVLEGSATFVTGGTVIAGATTAPDEIRGSSINGGETRVLAKGDVIIIPAGTPHWFKDVRGPLLYYTIKVR